MAILSRRRMSLAILMYELFMNPTQIDQFMPKHTAFEHSGACLSVVFELLPGIITFVIRTRWVVF